MAWVQARKPAARPKAPRGGWVAAGPGTRPITAAPKPPPIPPWAIGAPRPTQAPLTTAQQAAWAAGFQPPPVAHTGGTYDINLDPGVLGAREQEQLGLSQLDADLARTRREAIIRFGDPTMASVAGVGLSPEDAAFAQQNYLSGTAQLALKLRFLPALKLWLSQYCWNTCCPPAL